MPRVSRAEKELQHVLSTRGAHIAEVGVLMVKNLVGDSVTEKTWESLCEVVTKYDICTFEVVFALHDLWGEDAAYDYARAAKDPDVRFGKCAHCEREVPVFAGDCLFCGNIGIQYSLPEANP